MTEVYRNAFTEVYEIINYLDDNDYNKIPQEVIETIEENRNKEYEYFLDETIPLSEQEMLKETKAILFNFFRDYWATQIQREKILTKQKYDRQKLEEEKREQFNSDNIFKNRNSEKQESANNLPIEVKKESIYQRIVNFIKRIWN